MQKEKPHGWIWDIEADNLYLQATKAWYIRLKSFCGERSTKIYPFRQGVEETTGQLKEWIHSFDDGALVVGHNELGYDAWIAWRLYGIVPRVGKKGKDFLDGKEVQFIDTYVLSMFLQPDMQSHSLKALSKGSDAEKMDYRGRLVELGVMKGNEPKGFEFTFWHPLCEEYCDDDVEACESLFYRLWAKAKEMYRDKWLHASFRQIQKDYWLYSAQAYTGVLFHKERALKLATHIEAEMKVLKEKTDPLLPPRPLKTAEQAFYKIPAKPFTKNGEQSATFVKWLEKHSAVVKNGKIHAYDMVVPLKANEILPVKLPMEIDDNTELKDWFISQGWEASDGFWNFKKDPKTGKNMRDEKGRLIPTSPKIQSQGQICPNLLALEGEIPALVVKFLSYRNRLGVITGWLTNWRMEFDGRISAEISGYAPTSRVKHRTVTNVPKAADNVLLGAEMRELFHTTGDFHYVGVDASSLENCTLSHWTFKYDDGKFAEMQMVGDPHAFNAFAFFPHLHKKFDIENKENKEISEFKPWRAKAKTGAYLLAFGGGAPKLSSSLGLSQSDGKVAYDNYWTMNAGLGLLKTAVEKYYMSAGKGKFVPGIDGRLISVRGKNVLLSCLGQGTGAVVMSYAACLLDNWLGDLELDEKGRPHYLYKGKIVKRISMVHDEYSFEVEDGVEEEICELGANAIVKAGAYLKLALPLRGEGKIGKNWKDVH